MKATLHRGHTQFEDLGRLLTGQALQIAEYDHLPLLGRDLIQRPLQFLFDIEAVADGINHAVPTQKEMDASINWSESKGLFQRSGKKIQLTEEGRDFEVRLDRCLCAEKPLVNVHYDPLSAVWDVDRNFVVLKQRAFSPRDNSAFPD